MKPVPVETDQLMALLGGARTKFDAGDLTGAWDKLDEASDLAKGHGIRSSALLMSRSVTLVAMGEEDDAFEAVCEALVLDPVNPVCGDQFVTVATMLRTTLAASSISEPEEATPKVYALLSAVGETDAASHLALARYHGKRGEPEAAGKLLDAVTLLQPSCAEAWTLRALFEEDHAKRIEFFMRARELHAHVQTSSEVN